MNHETALSKATQRANQINCPVMLFLVGDSSKGAFNSVNWLYMRAVHYEFGEPNRASEADADAQVDADFIESCLDASFAPMTVLPVDYFA